LTDLKALVPDLKYGEALQIVEAQVKACEADLPELKYSALSETNLSGTALKIVMSPSIDRGMEARSGLLSAFERADEMALSIGISSGIFPSTLGTYESGAFEHSFVVDDFFPLTVSEVATSLQSFSLAKFPMKNALKLLGYDDSFINDVLINQQAENQANSDTLANSLSKFNTGG
jgi:hypothetical protein